MKRLQLVLLVLLPFLSASSQKKYYFRGHIGNVNDAKQNGSIEHPFESLGAFGKLDLKAGDTVFFHGGDVFSGTIRIIGINGTSKKPVVFTTYGKEKSKIYAGDKEGFVFTRVNPHDIGPQRLREMIYGKSERVNSQFNSAYATILNLYQHYQENLYDIYPKSFHYYQHDN